MRALRRLALAVALMVSAASPAHADGFISPFIGFNFGGDSDNCASLRNCQEKRTNWGVSFGSTHGIFGFEEDIGYARNFFGKTPGVNNSVFTLMSNLMVVVPAGPIQPYGIVGLGLIRPHVQFDPAALALDQNTLGYDIGAGVNVFLVPGVAVHGDVRHLHTLQDVSLGVFGGDKLDFWRGSAGLTFRF
jgi:outer membrane protein with beta-barrel domain